MFLSVNQNTTRGGVPESEDEFEDCRFTAACGADDADSGALWNFEGDVGETLLIGAILETDIFELDITALNFQSWSVGDILDGRLLLKNGEELVDAAEFPL
jgi:hypothetical protein